MLTQQERPLSMQIFGADKETFVEAAKYVDANLRLRYH